MMEELIEDRIKALEVVARAYHKTAETLKKDQPELRFLIGWNYGAASACRSEIQHWKTILWEDVGC